jgi:hypothetical protein
LLSPGKIQVHGTHFEEVDLLQAADRPFQPNDNDNLKVNYDNKLYPVN